MRFFVDVISPLIATAIFWTIFGACVGPPGDARPPLARLVVSWDPLACGDPHELELELVLDGGATAPRSASAPCEAGGLIFDAAQLGLYRGRIYSSRAEMPASSSVAITIDAPLVRWEVAPTP